MSDDENDLLMDAIIEAARHCEFQARITGKKMYLSTDGNGTLVVTNELTNLVVLESFVP